ncbi:DNA topoisomerase IB [Roseovarius sp. B08]|uniref:DNA topoisomerase IB n=1 Tax=Roseovarius sp. B08 TaxID=3449223 RepID=UPI003EDC3682
MAERLVYYPDSNPGIRREKRGRGFSYINVDGTLIDCPKKRRALQALAVPPAYTDVWIAPMDNAHLLATGRDARTRKQYRYHPDWAAQRAQTKFEGLAEFGRSLPRLRRWIDHHLSGEAGSEDTAVAAVLALVDRAALRPGSKAYTEENRTYGATTLKRRHLSVEGDAIVLAFKGKGGKQVEQTLRGRKLAKVMEACQDLPGPSLVSWLDEDGAARSVSSYQLNAKLNELCETEATAKTLRTWHGTLAAFLAAAGLDEISIRALAEAAAERLHNTPAIAQKSYIHPDVLELGRLKAGTHGAEIPKIRTSGDGFRRGEEALIKFIS